MRKEKSEKRSLRENQVLNRKAKKNQKQEKFGHSIPQTLKKAAR